MNEERIEANKTECHSYSVLFVDYSTDKLSVNYSKAPGFILYIEFFLLYIFFYTQNVPIDAEQFHLCGFT